MIKKQNGLVLADNVWGGSNLHMIMSDFPALIVVILFLFLSVIWIKRLSENSLLPIILGGVLGLGMLIRQELLIFLPVVALASLFGRKFDPMFSPFERFQYSVNFILFPRYRDNQNPVYCLT